MIKVKALIERGSDDRYGVYIDSAEEQLNYSIIGEGGTVEEAKEDFIGCYEDMKELFEGKSQPFTEAEFDFEYDVPSFLNHYSKVLSLAGLSRVTGINQRQLGHYVQGRKRPRHDTVYRIERSLKNLSRDLGQVRLCV